MATVKKAGGHRRVAPNRATVERQAQVAVSDKIFERLRIFVSSRMQELAPERVALRAALDQLNLDGWIFEMDAGARPEGIQRTYRQEINDSDLYIGVFWRDYGAYTIDEFNYAKEKNKDCLVYEKRKDIDGQRDPNLQEFLDQIGKVETGITVGRFNTLDELREKVKQDVTSWQARKIRELREFNVRYKSVPVDIGEQRDLNILLGNVRRFWVEGVLEKSMQRERLLEIGKDTQPEAVENPWEAVLQLPYKRSSIVPLGKGILDVFAEVERSLLILGQPGSGKTTTLLTLARELIKRAQEDNTEPVPVVFHLTTWIATEDPLSAWLENELSGKYRIPKRIGKIWLERHRLLPLLDGLDELSGPDRIACVGAINRFIKDIGLPGLVVCCRTEQYEELNIKLALNGAICLQPLTDAQIDAYVEEAGTPLAGLRNALRRDSILKNLARSPLMLNLMCVAYRDHDVEELAGRETPQDRSTHLFSTYVDLMFKRRARAERGYPRERTLAWLSWIAKRLLRQNQTMFLIEELQPDWLSTNAQRWAYLAGISLVLGLSMGLVNAIYWSTSLIGNAESNGAAVVWLTVMPIWFLVLGWADSVGSGSGRAVLDRLPPGSWRAAAKIVVSASAWLFLVAILWPFVDKVLRLDLLWAGVPMVLWIGAKGSNRSMYYSIETVESLGWSLAQTRRGVVPGLLSGLVVGSVVFLLPWELKTRLRENQEWFLFFGFAAVGLGIGGLLGGLRTRSFEGKTLPNQGIRLSLKTAIFVSLNAAWLVAIAVAFKIAGQFDQITLSRTCVDILLLCCPIIFLWFGGFEVLKHYVLRSVLGASGQLPLNLPRLLDHARSLNLMQRVGSAYIFVHRRLLEHLAISEQLVTSR
jgi:eukaryotic-like serine/threonine-protein kinase